MQSTFHEEGMPDAEQSAIYMSVVPGILPTGFVLSLGGVAMLVPNGVHGYDGQPWYDILPFAPLSPPAGLVYLEAKTYTPTGSTP